MTLQQRIAISKGHLAEARAASSRPHRQSEASGHRCRTSSRIEEACASAGPYRDPPRRSSARPAVSAPDRPRLRHPRSRPRPAVARVLEEKLGARWAVWIGGVALALGGHLPRALLHRAEPAQPRDPHRARRPLRARPDRRRRMAAPAGAGLSRCPAFRPPMCPRSSPPPEPAAPSPRPMPLMRSTT